jgi:hypothetical protein
MQNLITNYLLLQQISQKAVSIAIPPLKDFAE